MTDDPNRPEPMDPDHPDYWKTHEPELHLCGEHPHMWQQFEPCPLERGHDGPHVYWQQSRKTGAGHNGIGIYEEDGAALMHVTYEGPATAEEICVLMALQRAARNHPSEGSRQRPG